MRGTFLHTITFRKTDAPLYEWIESQIREGTDKASFTAVVRECIRYCKEKEVFKTD